MKKVMEMENVDLKSYLLGKRNHCSKRSTNIQRNMTEAAEYHYQAFGKCFSNSQPLELKQWLYNR